MIRDFNKRLGIEKMPMALSEHSVMPESLPN